MPTGCVLDIMRFSTRDGPGIRTTVFLKGCPLVCLWCHNPESQSRQPELMFRPNLCIGCMTCLDACTQHAIHTAEGLPVTDRAACTLCAACAEACTAEARVIAGREMSADEVLTELEKDAPFYSQSGGGVTFSGGEPLMQFDFLHALLQGSRQRGWHTAVDTSGYAPWSLFESLLPYVNLFLYDLKAVDDDLHQQFTGVSNRLILDNLRRLSGLGAHIVLRLPVIPGVNDTPAAMHLAGELAASLLSLEWVELLPYHLSGVEKYRRLDRPYDLPHLTPPDEQKMGDLAAQLGGFGVKIQVGG